MLIFLVIILQAYSAPTLDRSLEGLIKQQYKDGREIWVRPQMIDGMLQTTVVAHTDENGNMRWVPPLRDISPEEDLLIDFSDDDDDIQEDQIPNVARKPGEDEELIRGRMRYLTDEWQKYLKGETSHFEPPVIQPATPPLGSEVDNVHFTSTDVSETYGSTVTDGDTTDDDQYYDIDEQSSESDDDAVFHDCIDEECSSIPKRKSKKLKQKPAQVPVPPKEPERSRQKDSDVIAHTESIADYCWRGLQYCTDWLVRLIDGCIDRTSQVAQCFIRSMVKLAKCSRGRRRSRTQTSTQPESRQKYVQVDATRVSASFCAGKRPVPWPPLADKLEHEILKLLKPITQLILTLRSFILPDHKLQPSIVTQGIKDVIDLLLDVYSRAYVILNSAEFQCLGPEHQTFLKCLMGGVLQHSDMIMLRYNKSTGRDPRIHEPHFIPNTFPEDRLEELKKWLVDKNFVPRNKKFIRMRVR
jgi:hypothetical protein